MLVEQEKEEDDEQKLPVLAPYIYDARYHAYPFFSFGF